MGPAKPRLVIGSEARLAADRREPVVGRGRRARAPGRAGELDAAAGRAVRGFFAWRAEPAWRRAGVLLGIAHGLAADGEALARTLALEAAKPIVRRARRGRRAAQTFTLASEESQAPRRRVPAARPPARHRGPERASSAACPPGPCSASRRSTFRSTWSPTRSRPRSPAGCSIVIKPAPQTPLTALRLQRHRARGRRCPTGVFPCCPRRTSSRRAWSRTSASPRCRSRARPRSAGRSRRAPGRSASCSSSAATRR